VSIGDEFQDHKEELLLNIFRHNTEAYLTKAVHHKGTVATLTDDLVNVDRTLFDTGALHGSYIRADFVKRNRYALKPFLIKRKHRVTLADNKTSVDITEAYVLSVTFSDDQGKQYTGSVLFWVLPEMNHEMIVGLPAILRHFSELHKRMIDAAIEVYASTFPNTAPHSQLNWDNHTKNKTATVDNIEMQPGETGHPWTLLPEEIAPEDEATELPSSFPDALHYMEMSYEDAVQEYLDLMESHVCKQFAEQTDIIQLLKSKGVNVFVPQNWEGIKGVPDVQLEWKEGLPDRLKPRPRPVNPKLYVNAKKEFDRLRHYFYRESSSPIASCLVIAPKATSPFIRFCGDYVGINKFIKNGHYPIPDVKRNLEKLSKFRVYLDFDMANSFHQFRLTPETSEKLSIQTPWGQFAPVFMPEGISPASFILQKAVTEIFEDFAEWAVVIFDNLLVLATDFEDAYKKVELILEKCMKHNIYLKFSKTWLGYAHANFFGYVCRHGSYELSAERKETIHKFPFPKSLKQMQSFLGMALFFKDFVPHFSSVASPLYEMVKKDFNWDESTWQVDYHAIFEGFKDSLIESMAIYYPDYNLDWILRTDASNYGIGAVLLQVYIRPETSTEIMQPIGFFSEKFSPQATRWSTIEQEAYAVYAAVKNFAYYLHCKEFVLETDHNNLLFMELSVVPKIIRWRIYLQSFLFLIRHIPGKMNSVADWLSRWEDKDSSNQGQVLSEVTDTDPSAILPKYRDKYELLREVHGGRMGHFGTRKTWLLLNELFPGHQVSYAMVAEFVATCAICQKDRLGMVDFIEPVVRHLKPDHRRSVLGVDTLTVTPQDETGCKYVIVATNHFTKFVVLTPAKNHDALSVATALFSYFCCFGLVDVIMTDPGTEFANETVDLLHKWLGVRHRFSLVDRHESNGVEGSNKQILRHLKALVHDERILKNWVSALPMVQYMMNSSLNSETSLVPFEAHFGSVDAPYCKFPDLVEGEDGAVRAHAYLN
jgi:hypothetical protein